MPFVSDFKDCDLVVRLQEKEGHCAVLSCDKELKGRRRRWCSDKCRRSYENSLYDNHEWNSARSAAKRRDKKTCQTCGKTPPEVKLEVNHVIPRNGAGYGPGHHNHLSNLITLCHECHVKVTAQQRKLRKALKNWINHDR